MNLLMLLAEINSEGFYTSLSQFDNGEWQAKITASFSATAPEIALYNAYLDIIDCRGSPRPFALGDHMELDDLIKDINSQGFLVSNLFQFSENRWQANLRTSTGAIQQEYASAPTPYAALALALEKMQAPKSTAKPANSAGLSLLSSIGLSLGVKLKIGEKK